jgi:catechol 2,3-dioxygenase-like lactoylglutathione lyase family enzyme
MKNYSPKLLVALIMLCFVSKNHLAQSLNTPKTPGEIIKKTIEASGGNVWKNPKTLQLEGKAIVYFSGQPKKLTLYKMWRIFPAENNEAHSANGKIRFDAFEGDDLFFQIAFDGQKTYQKLSDQAKPYSEFLRWSNNFGFSIFRYTKDNGFKIELLPEDSIDAHECYFLKITDPSKHETIFGIDKNLFFIRYVAFRTPIGFHQRIYDDFSRDPKTGFIQPLRLRIFNEGIKIADIFWEKFKINEPIADQIFSLK